MLGRNNQKVSWAFGRKYTRKIHDVYREALKNFPIPQRYNDNIKRYETVPGNLYNSEVFGKFKANNTANEADIARFYFFCLVFDQIMKENVDGDLAELGVYKGNTAAIIAEMARKRDVTAWLLDTFEGFAAEDLAGVDFNKRPEFGDTSFESIKALVGETNTRFIKGRFPETAAQINPSAKFCLVHLDCDLYAPFKSALEYFYPRLAPGGFLIMHDYSSLHWNGAEQAVDEFFLDKPEPVIPVPDSAGTVVIRKIREADPRINWRSQSLRDGFAKSWLSAAHGGLVPYQGSGWSGNEDWGSWGIGASHELNLAIDAPSSGDVILEADVVAVLRGARAQQTVDIYLDDELVDSWQFTAENNRGVRRVVIPLASIKNMEGLPVIPLAFRPHAYESPSQLDPEEPDDRELGLGIYRLRYRFAWPAPPATGDAN